MKCNFCNDTGKIKRPKDEKEFNKLVELECDKAYFVTRQTAEEKIYKKIGYDLIDCPYCKKSSL